MKSLWQRHLFLPPATKLGQGYIFTGVCDSVHREGGACSQGGSAPRGSAPGVVPGRGGILLPGGLLRGGAWWRPPQTATAAGGTHPTGMHSCSKEECSLILTAS